ncbi:fimbrial biogenesis chaperone [Stenotrophomonas maltophilia]|uniref:fimbrial biogenesis chaperone n=1 Tax=Stenotrophomonas maltophilia TaxID=40324 RepID=UPI001FA7BF8D|nr:fimbria/pilus periplasmic chaperone [Stenotrophomonas maltophilia]
MNAMHGPILRTCFALTGFLVASAASAGVVIEGTRVIFNEGMAEATLRVGNPGTAPVLLQSWVDTLEEAATPTTTKAPFVLLPPISRVEAGKSQVLRMKLAAGELPRDQESAFWLNVLEVPAIKIEKEQIDGYLQVTVRNRLKIFYRPKGLSASGAGKAPAGVQWSVVPHGNGVALQAKNDSAYHVNMVKAWLVEGNKESEAEGMQMLLPYSSTTFKVPGPVRMPANATLKVRYINDFGGVVNTTMPLSMP